MSELELTPDLRRVEDTLRRSGDDGARLLAGATTAATTPARDLQALIDLHADEALAFLEALTGDSKLALEVLEETLAMAAPPLDLADLLGLARARATRRLAAAGVSKTGPLDLPVDARALLLLRHGLGLSTVQLARAGEARPGTALAHAAERLERAVPTPTHPDSAELARLLARDVADVADAGDRARLEALTLDPALAPTVERVRAALSVPVVVAPAELRARVDARRTARESDRVVKRVALRCTYCHDALAGEDSCHCAACLAPHHLDCFDVHGRCGVHGCGESRFVRAGVPTPRPAQARSPWWFAAGGAVGGALVTAAAFLAAGPRVVVVPVPAPAPAVEAPVAPRKPTPKPVDTSEPLGNELRRRMEEPTPDWRAIAARAFVLVDRATTPEERAELRSIIDECEVQARDEELYSAATDIVRVLDVARYPEALRLLAQIDRRSRIHPDAQAYAGWIEADLLVREAEGAYAQGDGKRAQELLSRALTTEALGPDARASIARRRVKWQRVVSTYEDSVRLLDEGRVADAEAELLRLLPLEPDALNRYHVRAKASLEHIESLRTGSRETALRDGLDALASDDFAVAGQRFRDLTRRQGVTEAELSQVRAAVAAKVERRRLVADARETLALDRAERFLDAYYAMRLLTRFLPADHPSRAEAETLERALIDRLKARERQVPPSTVDPVVDEGW